MTLHARAPGATALAQLSDLPPREAAAIHALRAWCEGPEGQQRLWTSLSEIMGPPRGRQTLSALEQLIGLCDRHGRRPLMRNRSECPCAGADECWFARLVGLAAEGRTEDAIMVGMVFVRPDVAMILPDLARQVGLTLPTGQTRTTRSLPQPGQTLH